MPKTREQLEELFERLEQKEKALFSRLKRAMTALDKVRKQKHRAGLRWQQVMMADQAERVAKRERRRNARRQNEERGDDDASGD